MLTNKDYCDYDTQKSLMELGFPMQAQSYDLGSGLKEYLPKIHLFDAQKLLREEKNIIVDVFVDDDSDTPITYNVHKDGECVIHHHGRYFAINDWNLALLEGIKEAVKILKEEK